MSDKKKTTKEPAAKTQPAPPEILGLVEKFAEHAETYHRGNYNEAQVRQDFLDPFFIALGWDVYNRDGLHENYRDVILEQGMQVEKSVRAPDYCFRIGGTKKFFVEAKKPSVDIKTNVGPAFQLRRYAWTAKLPVSILTDFEEFAVYDCRVKPDKDDAASTARVLFLRYTEYADRWDEIAGIFSRDAILKGAFDKFADSTKKKRGTAEVDAAFLEEIESWREALAKNLSARNESLSDRELNTAVQLIIDRIIFLRMCEGRGIEDYGRLQALLNGERVYPRLVEMFHRADEKYNSGLFHFQKEKGRENPDTLTTSLGIDDKVLKDIAKRLYYPESPYEFAAMPAEILGQVYEQFLGKVIRLTAGHRAKVEEKPEVRKAGGVYYTPKYIVDYIVENTVGKLVEGKTPQEVGGLTEKWKPSAKLRPLSVLDPACGSGSFLIVAYQYLLDWYLKQYTEVDKPESHSRGANPQIYQTGTGDWRLTIAERKRILLAHIYGVDIDYQACEVTKLSLLLKALEGETKETIDRLLFYKERALPDLANNIKCGNSLIGTDYWKGRQRELLDDAREEEERRINSFDWQSKHGFPEIFSGKNPGFDAVIGNPPWGGDIDRELRYFHLIYPLSTQEHTDSFKLFIDQAIRLARLGGRVSLIVPQPVLRQRRLKDIRALILQSSIERIVDLGEDVFQNVVAPSCIFVVRKEAPDSNHSLCVMDVVGVAPKEKPSILKNADNKVTKFAQSSLAENADLEFRVPMISRSKKVVPFGSIKEFKIRDAGINYQRVKVGMQEKGKSDLATRLLYDGRQERSKDNMYWKGTDIDRYWIATSTERWCRPDVKLRSNEVVRLNEGVYKTVPKILIRQTADRPIAVMDEVGVWFGRSIIAITANVDTRYSPHYFLGLLNSRYMTYAYHHITSEQGRVFAQVKLAKLKQLPFRVFDFSTPRERELHDSMVDLVQQMLELHARLAKVKTAHERTTIERRIEATDREIDQLVYELYSLTDKEIALVEEGTR